MQTCSQNFSPARRLHFPFEYRRFFKQNEVIRIAECIIFRIPNGLLHYRVGITIKARGSSLERNHVKRQIREYFRKNESVLGCYDYNVVIPKTKKMSFPYPYQLRDCLKGQFSNAVSEH